MIYSYDIQGLPIQSGDILCLAFDKDENVSPGQYWRILGLLIPGEVDHVAIYTGPGGQCVEASAKGVISFEIEDNEWSPEKMFKHRGPFLDHLVGIVYPLHGLELPADEEIQIRKIVAAYCLEQVELKKTYNFNLLDPDRDDSFYCSQLAYKAYGLHGINLNTGRGVPDLPGTGSIVFPQEIWSGFYHRIVGGSRG